MSSLTSLFSKALQDTIFYYRATFYFANGGKYPKPSTKKSSLTSLDRLSWDTRACVVLFSMQHLTFHLWDKETYRNPSFQVDLQKNLRNVNIPGTSMALSRWCLYKWTMWILLLFVVPMVSFIAAWYKSWVLSKDSLDFWKKLFQFYSQHLLHPPDWFRYWQINCRLATWHAMVSKVDGYEYEDKWTFLLDGDKLSVPVSPFLKEPMVLVAKDTNEEGGMGIHFYENAVHGGRWILQKKMENGPEISRYLPDPSPLSTIRVVSASTFWLEQQKRKNSGKPQETVQDWRRFIKPVSHVFRAGRRGASTDHSSILFDVDENGEILRGTTNEHWYKKGRWCSFEHEYSHHPDVPESLIEKGIKQQVTGGKIDDFEKILDLVCESHWKMMKNVPLVGWDVAYTKQGICFLEVNLSCNFFRGTFDESWYFNFVDDYYRELSKLDHGR